MQKRLIEINLEERVQSKRTKNPNLCANCVVKAFKLVEYRLLRRSRNRLHGFPNFEIHKITENPQKYRYYTHWILILIFFLTENSRIGSVIISRKRKLLETTINQIWLEWILDILFHIGELRGIDALWNCWEICCS